MSHKVSKVLQISEEVALKAASVFRSPSQILEYGVRHHHLQLCLDPYPQEQREYVSGFREMWRHQPYLFFPL